MIKLITGEQFSGAAIDVQFLEFTTEKLLADEPTGDFFRNYVLLEHFPEKEKDMLT